MSAVDWPLLRVEALRMTRHAYAPYSGLSVGACGITDSGRLVYGCNVENASYGLSLCAECGVVSALLAGGGGRIVAIAVRSADGQTLLPCGRCRQLLLEHGDGTLLVDHDNGPVTLDTLMPDAFGPDDLPSREKRP